jgi:hypothetical protein
LSDVSRFDGEIVRPPGVVSKSLINEDSYDLSREQFPAGAGRLVGYCGVECSKEEEAHEDPPSTQYFQQLFTLLWNSCLGTVLTLIWILQSLILRAILIWIPEASSILEISQRWASFPLSSPPVEAA